MNDTQSFVNIYDHFSRFTSDSTQYSEIERTVNFVMNHLYF